MIAVLAILAIAGSESAQAARRLVLLPARGAAAEDMALVEAAVRGALPAEVTVVPGTTAPESCADADCLARLAAELGADAALATIIGTKNDELCVTLRLLSFSTRRLASLEEEERCGPAGEIESAAALAVQALLQRWQREPGTDAAAPKGEQGFVPVAEQPLATPPRTTPRRRLRGLLVGGSLESDVLAYDYDGFAATLGAFAAWDDDELGAELALLATLPVGVRLEGRFFLLSKGWLRPYLGVGTSIFAADLSLRGSLGAHALVGPVVVVAALGYDYFPRQSAMFRDRALVVSLGAAYNLF